MLEILKLIYSTNKNDWPGRTFLRPPSLPLTPLSSFWISKGRYQTLQTKNATGHNWVDLQPIRNVGNIIDSNLG